MGRVHLLSTLLMLTVACGPSSNLGGDGGGTGVDADPSSPDADPNRPDSAPPAALAAVYAHSSSALYKVDPDDLSVTLVGSFMWPSGSDVMTDIAIDKDGLTIGISYDTVYRVDKNTAACTFLASLQAGRMFNGLSFVPGAGPDPNGPERLVGANTAGEVYEINPMTGASTLVGNYGGGYGSSGDIVSVRGFGTVATVTTGIGTDQLARLDPVTFAATPIGNTGFDDIWGVGFWENKIFGFTDNQRFVLIDAVTGVGTEVEIGTVRWWGAAVTTSAPVVD
ncbi:MAG TPA: hypothetical protein VML75_11720 [Kofleriaceae bacterium]|nr:hypothetical protein [Kofleriaceae bacterium]